MRRWGLHRWGLGAALVAASIMVTTGPVSGDANEAPVGNIPATVVTAGASHTCALLDNGRVTCWGEGTSGRLGNGSEDSIGDDPGEMGDNLPTVDLGTGRIARAITAGRAHTCALLSDNTVKCWGAGVLGQLGQGDPNARGEEPGDMGNALLPVDLGTGRTARAITAGDDHTCALLDNSTVKCWGDGEFGQLGQGDGEHRGDGPDEMGDDLPPVQFGPERTARAVTAGAYHTCVLRDDSTVTCWGEGGNGQLGNGFPGDIGNLPGTVGGAIDLGTGRTATAVTTADNHTCALLDDATVKCWGRNFYGQLGQGDQDDRGAGGNDMMGDVLPAIDLPRLVGRATLTVRLTAARPQVVVGKRIAYTVTVRNTGSVPLTQIDIDASGAAACNRVVPALAPQTTTTYRCTYTTARRDRPRVSNQLTATTAQGAAAISARVRTRVDPVVVRVDGLIRPGAKRFVGNDVYNTTGARQIARASASNRPARYTWRIQNDGNVTDRFVVRGTAGTDAFTVTYKRGRTNITAAVRSGSYTTPRLAPGKRTDITVIVRATARVAVGDSHRLQLVARSTTTARNSDTVRAVTTRR
jgi:hypothetical protein